jgi:hypothetical protein
MPKFDDSTIARNLAIAAEYFKAYYPIAYKDKKFSGGTTGFIPFNIEFTIDGLSGIKIYNKLRIDASFLPAGYTKTIDFIVTGIEHKLKDGDWETVIKTTMIPKLEATEVVVTSANFKYIAYKDPVKIAPVVVINPLTPNKLGGIRGDFFSWVPGPNYPDPSNPQNYNGTIYPYNPSKPDFIYNLYTETKRIELLNFQKEGYVLGILKSSEASNKKRAQDFIQKPSSNPPVIKSQSADGRIKYQTTNFTEAEQEKMFTDILTRLSSPSTEYNLLWMKLWRDAEGASATYNPWNSTQKKNGSTKYNGIGVQNYFSFQDGLDATISTMTNGKYSTILKALKKGLSSYSELIELATLVQMWDMTGKIPAKWN